MNFFPRKRYYFLLCGNGTHNYSLWFFQKTYLQSLDLNVQCPTCLTNWKLHINVFRHSEISNIRSWGRGAGIFGKKIRCWEYRGRCRGEQVNSCKQRSLKNQDFFFFCKMKYCVLTNKVTLKLCHHQTVPKNENRLANQNICKKEITLLCLFSREHLKKNLWQ